jgi:hypothetical protein
VCTQRKEKKEMPTIDDRAYLMQIQDAIAHLGPQDGPMSKRGLVSRVAIAHYVSTIRFGVAQKPSGVFKTNLFRALRRASHGPGAVLEQVGQSFRLCGPTAAQLISASVPEWMHVLPRYITHPVHGKCRVVQVRAADNTAMTIVAPNGATYNVDRKGNCTLVLVYQPSPSLLAEKH